MLPFLLPCLQHVFYFPSLIFWWWILPSWFLFKFLNFSVPEFPQFTFSSLILFPLLDLEHFYSFPFSICVCVFLDFFKWLFIYTFLYSIYILTIIPLLFLLLTIPIHFPERIQAPIRSQWSLEYQVEVGPRHSASRLSKRSHHRIWAPLRASVVFKQTVSWWISISLYTFWNSYCCWYPALTNGSQIRCMVLFFLYLLRFSLCPNKWLILEKFDQLLSWKYLDKIFLGFC